MTSRFLGAVYVGVFALGINASVHASDYTFTKIIDTNDTIPGRTDTFTRFHTPSLDGRNVAFAGDRNSDYSAVFTYGGGRFNLVADSNTPIPRGVGNFDTLEFPIIDKGNVAFVGTQNSGFEAHGIYTDLGGSLRVVADHNTPIPGGTGTFGFFTDEDHDFGNGVVAFKAWEGVFSGQTGVYADVNGTLSVVANENTPVPDGSGNFIGAGLVGVNGTDVAFGGTDGSGVSAIYLNSGGSISLMFDEPYISLVDVAAETFVGRDQAGNILTNVGGTLHVAATIGDLTPDGIGSFAFFDNLDVDGDDLAFTAGDDIGDLNDVNIYSYFGNTLDEVISIGDTLDDKPVTSLNMHMSGIDDNAIAFLVGFEDGSNGIYLAEVSNIPIPPAVWLFGSGLLGLIGIARRKKAA